MYVTNAKDHLKDLLAADEDALPPDMFKTLADVLGPQSQGQSTTLLWGFVPEGHHNPAKGALAEILDRQMATKAEVTDHENNLQHAIEVLRLELKRDLAETNARIAETKAELTRWVIGAGVLQTTIIIGVLLKVVKLV